ncbi:MAG: family 10 glycosylhydrolase [Candidatus Cloacimonetes bacterium]|nr:family 10 glycosylhydrolase [Candidatus Cloacimonadota bacterium]
MIRAAALGLLIFFTITQLPGEIRALWVPSWELTSPENIDQLVQEAKNNRINKILAEVRYRADCLYFPNKNDSTFPNPEPRSYLLAATPDFDPLEYLIQKSSGSGIEIHAWLTTYVVTTHKLENLAADHLYFTHPEWITHDFRRQAMKFDSQEGAYLDPGIPEVSIYLLNIIMDILKNYRIAGIHLDYLRYPDINYGYNPQSYILFKAQTRYQDYYSWQRWKQDQISQFINALRISMRNTFPGVKLSAAVFPDLMQAKNFYAQNWHEWLIRDLVDQVYLMAYTSSNDNFRVIMDKVVNLNLNDMIVIGLRAWSNNNEYPARQINDKVKMVKKSGFAGLSFFSYTGIKENNYFQSLKY